MIKFLISLVKIVVTAIVALLFGACQFNHNSIKGSGNVVSKTREIKDFTKVEVSKALDCEVFQSDKYKVIIIADDNLQNHIHTTVKNGTLKITSDYGNYRNVKSKLIQVYLPIVEGLEANSASNLSTKGVIKSNLIKLKSSSAADLNATIESEKIYLEASSGSDLTVDGKAINLTTHSSSGSDIKATQLLANNIDAESTSGSSTSVNPILQLNAKASSGSGISYIRKPKSISKQTSSGGSILQE